jgi:glycosyltransferase involved in cell wall biosynthesis
MKPMHRIAFIGNHLPRQCGIATFTHDLHLAVATARPDLETGIVAMTDQGRQYDYPPSTLFEVREEITGDYVRAAALLEATGVDLVSLQHEYGIFGGEAGADVLELLSRLTMPIVTTLHTVLERPTAAQRDVMNRIIDISSKLIVMAGKARDLLRTVHDVPDDKIEIIPHGIPDHPFTDPAGAKLKFGFAKKKIILTFGLLAPNKGIETMLDAMPGIIRSCPDAVYVVLGATHPRLLRDQGEAYRESLEARARDLGIEDQVVVVNRFVDQPTLLNYIAMCDVYVTPYLNEAQMTSGTLAYSFGMGSAIVSTPYWHAVELLRDGLGIMVPFGGAAAMSCEIGALLTGDARRQAMRERAYAASRSMTWSEIGRRYAAVFEAARGKRRAAEPKPPRRLIAPADTRMLPEIRLEHFLSLCDDTGMLQHATYATANRAHGYCIDDNARALLLACSLEHIAQARVPDGVTARFTAFIDHAWNEDTGRFRNFMSFDRGWLETVGSEDSHGRTLWALGEHARLGTAVGRPVWADALFAKAMSAAEAFRSPRAWAFTLLGLDAWCEATEGDLRARRLRVTLADRLMAALRSAERPDWTWFEDVLAYDNARLSQALIQTGATTGTSRYVEAGIRTLSWLTTRQTASLGHFRPVGTDSFHGVGQHPRLFDQQPLEAAASVSACLAAWRAGGDPVWRARALTAFRWFTGHNDLATSLIDPATGGCADGLHPGGLNENMGAESVLSYLLALAELRRLSQVTVVPEAVAELARRTANA